MTFGRAYHHQIFRFAAKRQTRWSSSTGNTRAQWGFIGLGRMGFPMAKNLRAKMPESDELVVYDLNSAALHEFGREHKSGVRIAKTVKDVAHLSDTIITVLPAPQHVRSLFEGILRELSACNESPNKDRLFIDCSTIDPLTSAQTADATRASGQGMFVDAPMSGGTTAAKAGALTFMFGSSPELVPRVQEVLSLMGKRAVHLGPQTSGLKGKLANNYLLAISNIATAEAMNMGIKWGLDPRALGDLINTCSGRCWSSEINNPVAGVSTGAPAGRDYEGGFETALMLKDLKLAMEGAREYGIEACMGPTASTIYTTVDSDEQLKGKDFSVVYEWLRQRV